MWGYLLLPVAGNSIFWGSSFSGKTTLENIIKDIFLRKTLLSLNLSCSSRMSSLILAFASLFNSTFIYSSKGPYHHSLNPKFSLLRACWQISGTSHRCLTSIWGIWRPVQWISLCVVVFWSISEQCTCTSTSLFCIYNYFFSHKVTSALKYQDKKHF